MKRILIIFSLLVLSIPAFSQVYTKQDNAGTNRQAQGGFEALKWFRLPVEGGHSIPAGDSLWFVRVNPNDGQVYMWDGLTWGCISCGGGGTVDSTLFVTITRLQDSLNRVQSTLDDSTNVLRGLIAGGSADSSVFATLYRLDTTRAGLDMRIALKQNQLNGTGFVKVSGTTVTYDNSTYVPVSRTITINGTSQDLSANRSWTISSSADSSIFATNYRVDTAKAALRSSINNKQNLITLTTTGTSGAATFNQSTGALNIPNYANTTYTGSTSIILTSGSFQRAALTGDVTASANNNATTIANNAVTNAKAADMAVNTIKGRITAGTGDPEDLSASQVRTIINVADGAEVNVNADWNAVSGDAQILNKPTIPDVSGLATQQGLDDTSAWVRDSINALRADIGSGGGGGLDTTAGDARYWKQGGNAVSGALVGGTTTNQSVRIIANNSPQIEAASGGVITFGGASQVSLTAASNRIVHNAVLRHEWRTNNQSGRQLSSADGNLGIGMPNNTSPSHPLHVIGESTTVGNIALFENSAGTDALIIRNDLGVEVNTLSGTGTRMVVADDGGELGTQAIPDTTSLSNRINLKLDITDTAGKWIPAGTTVTNWSGGSTGLNAATGRTSLGGTTVGQNIFTLTNPSAITFLRINANNTVSALSASDFRTAIGAGTGNGTVTSVGLSMPTGFSVSSSPVTSSGTIVITYAAGYQGYTSTEASKLSNIEANADVTDATNVAAAGAVMFTDTATTVATKTDLITNRLVTFNTQSGTSYTLVAGDFDGRTVVLSGNANPITITVPPGMVIGSSVLVEQTGAGQITFDPGSGVTLHSFESKLTTAGTNATVTIYCKDTDTYTLTGNLE